jgi:hypothetical protein
VLAGKNERIASLVNTLIAGYEEQDHVARLSDERDQVLQTLRAALACWRPLAERAGAEELERWRTLNARADVLAAGAEEVEA